MMANEGWLPHDYQDEMTPPPRQSPDAWIVSLDDGAPALAAADPAGDPDNAWSRPKRLIPGEIVGFDNFIAYGGGTLTVHNDGSFSADPPMPAEANCVRSDLEFENVACSIAELVHEGNGWPDDGPLRPGIYELDYYYWSEQPIPFRFDAAARRFVPAAAEERPHEPKRPTGG